jgi:Ca-activated chloride channel family protein
MMFFRSPRLYWTLLAGCILWSVLSRDHLSGQGASNKAAAPNSQLPQSISDQTWRVIVDIINVPCSVLDKNTNAFVTSLTRDDFTVFEDNQKQEIKYFEHERNLPLTIAMLVDTSDSVASKLKFEQEAATSFFQTILSDKDRAMLVEFDSRVNLVQDFTSDPNKLAKQIQKLRAAGGTALYDAIYTVCDEKLIREIGRKVIIILSDGADRNSDTTLRQAMEMALRSESTIYAISVTKGGFSNIENNDEGDDVLREMAKETGGAVYFPFKVEELDVAFRKINEELRSQYSIGYTSNNPLRDGSYRKIDIKVPDKGLRLSHRKGYYAPTS